MTLLHGEAVQGGGGIYGNEMTWVSAPKTCKPILSLYRLLLLAFSYHPFVCFFHQSSTAVVATAITPSLIQLDIIYNQSNHSNAFSPPKK